MGSPRPSPRRWLRSKVASAAAMRRTCNFELLENKKMTPSLSGILLLLSRLSPSERTQEMVATATARRHNGEASPLPRCPTAHHPPSSAAQDVVQVDHILVVLYNSIANKQNLPRY
ncbi:hypothetical protein F4823DRAFT_129799 [Ustulina deusta]|nr:hypothetical protein F4823DRAFT_129799 [Ustulina deusta]